MNKIDYYCYGVGGTKGAARRLAEERSHVILSPARRGKQSPVYLSSLLFPSYLVVRSI
jgi:hypothetical protein